MILSTFDQDVLAVGGSYLNSLLDESIVYHLDASGFSGEVDRIIIGEVAEFALITWFGHSPPHTPPPPPTFPLVSFGT